MPEIEDTLTEDTKKIVIQIQTSLKYLQESVVNELENITDDAIDRGYGDTSQCNNTFSTIHQIDNIIETIEEELEELSKINFKFI